MSIRLFNRIARLLAADAHGVIESLEQRSLLLKQYVREAEIDLDRKRARLEAIREDGKRLREVLAKNEGEMRALDEDITLAMAGGKDDLARFAIRRLIPRRRDAEALRLQIERGLAEESALGERIEAQEARFEDLRARVRAEIAHGGQTAETFPGECEAGVADEEVELELMRRRQQEGGTR